MFAYGFGDGTEDDAFLCERVTEGGLDGYGVHHCVHRHIAGQGSPLLKRYSEFVKGLHYLRIDLFLTVGGMRFRGGIVGDGLKIDVGYIEVRPCRHGHSEPFAVGFEPEL